MFTTLFKRSGMSVYAVNNGMVWLASHAFFLTLCCYRNVDGRHIFIIHCINRVWLARCGWAAFKTKNSVGK